MAETLKEMLTRHEGLRFYPYVDSVGKTTIGVGHNLDDRGLSRNVIMLILKEDIDVADAEAVKWLGEECFYSINDARKMVVVNMMFNMGYDRLGGFIKFKKALRQYDYDEAAHQMEDSKWCEQVGKRCRELCAVMRNGELVK